MFNLLKNSDIEDAKKLSERNLMTEFRPGLGQFANYINSFIKDVRENFTDFGFGITKIVEHTREVGESIAGCQETFHNLNQNINLLSQDMDNYNEEVAGLRNTFTNFLEVNEESRLLSHNVKESLQSVDESVKIGEQEYKEMIDLIIKSGEAFKVVSDEINRLSLEMNAMHEIIEEVKSIARKTSMLSLNASIEAQRAGEAGKGFAVVAHEVGALSQNSEDSASKVEDTISKIAQDAERISLDVKEKIEDILENIENIKNRDQWMKNIAIATTNATQEMEKLTANTIGRENLDGDVRQVIDMMEGLIENVYNITCDLEKNTQKYNQDVDNMRLKLLENEKSAVSINHDIIAYSASLKLDDNMRRRINEGMNIMKNLPNKEQLLDKSLNKESRRRLKQLVKNYPYFEVICALNEEGFSYVSSVDEEDYVLNFKNRDYFKEAIRGRTYASSPYLSQDTYSYSLAISFPISSHGKSIGVLMADIALKE